MTTDAEIRQRLAQCFELVDVLEPWVEAWEAFWQRFQPFCRWVDYLRQQSVPEKEVARFLQEECRRLPGRTSGPDLPVSDRDWQNLKPYALRDEAERYYERVIRDYEAWVKKTYTGENERLQTVALGIETSGSELPLTEAQVLSQEIALRNVKIIQQKDTIKALRLKTDKPSLDELRKLIDRNRFHSSAKANYSAIGKILGRDPDTVKRWIMIAGLRPYAEDQ